jgi:selenocysteine lyase/cysteine desulfurase
VAGMEAAVNYLAELGRTLATGKSGVKVGSRREDLVCAMTAIQDYEGFLSKEMLRVLKQSGATIYGVSNEEHLANRVPTLCFNLPNVPPATVTETMASAGIGIRDGHMYSPRLMRRLGLSTESGAVRASLVHYNTIVEIREFEKVLQSLTHRK